MSDYRNTPWEKRKDSEFLLLLALASADGESGLTVNQLHAKQLKHLKRTGVDAACRRLWGKGYVKAWRLDSHAHGRPPLHYTITAAGKRRLQKKSGQ